MVELICVAGLRLLYPCKRVQKKELERWSAAQNDVSREGKLIGWVVAQKALVRRQLKGLGDSKEGALINRRRYVFCARTCATS